MRSGRSLAGRPRRALGSRRAARCLDAHTHTVRCRALRRDAGSARPCQNVAAAAALLVMTALLLLILTEQARARGTGPNPNSNPNPTLTPTLTLIPAVTLTLTQALTVFPPLHLPLSRHGPKAAGDPARGGDWFCERCQVWRAAGTHHCGSAATALRTSTTAACLAATWGRASRLHAATAARLRRCCAPRPYCWRTRAGCSRRAARGAWAGWSSISCSAST